MAAGVSSPPNADFDKADFQLIFALERRCGQLDREAAKTLYAKVYESSEPAATSVATKDQEDFFTRRAEVLRAMFKSISVALEPAPSLLPPAFGPAPRRGGGAVVRRIIARA